MKNKGINYDRVKYNALEYEFAKEWEKENKSCRTLEYLLANFVNHPVDGEVSKRDREVAATVIQWLGSTCGQSFLNTVNGKKF